MMMTRKCRCGGVGQNCQMLKRRLQAVDFALTETVLYLDAYPHCEKALAYHARLVAERETLVNALQTQCGMPITALDNASTTTWDWIKGPWPWENEAN